jgi:hypothetical protein
MTDFTINQLTAIAAALAANTEFECQRNGQSGTEKFTGSDLMTLIRLLNVYSHASTKPGVSNDNTQGYAVGSIGIVTGPGDTYICRDASTGAAKWVRIANSEHFDYIANNYVLLGRSASLIAGPAMGTGTIRLNPFILRQRCTISQLGVRISTLAASGNIQCALYNAVATTLLPGTLIDKTASVSTTSNNVTVAGALGASQQLEPGLYWSAAQCDNVAAAIINHSQSEPFISNLIGDPTAGTALGTGVAIAARTVAGTFGTWPDLTGATSASSGSNRAPAIVALIASRP